MPGVVSIGGRSLTTAASTPTSCVRVCVPVVVVMRLRVGDEAAKGAIPLQGAHSAVADALALVQLVNVGCFGCLFSVVVAVSAVWVGVAGLLVGRATSRLRAPRAAVSIGFVAAGALALHGRTNAQ